MVDWLGHGGLQRKLFFSAGVLCIHRLMGVRPDFVAVIGVLYSFWALYANDYLWDCRSEGDMLNNPARTAFYAENFATVRGLLVGGGVALAAVLLAGLACGRIGAGCLLPLAAMWTITLTYPMKLLPGSKPLKAIPGVKLLQLGVWYAMVPLLTAQVGGLALHANVFLLALAFGTWAMTAANVSDIHDIDGDRSEGIITLPVLWGSTAAWALSLAGSVATSALLWSVSPGVASGITAVILVGMTVSVLPHLPRRLHQGGSKYGSGPSSASVERAPEAPEVRAAGLLTPLPPLCWLENSIHR